MLDFENLDKYLFLGTGKYNVPKIEPVKNLPEGEFIPVNFAKTEKNPKGKIVHCFTDDYQFSRFWNRPDDYINLLQKFSAVCSPDFSLYTNMPLAMQIYNHYRKHWLAAYWQMNGITVIPTIAWSTEDSYAWCFDGEPVGGVVAVSSVGTQNNKEAKRLFLRGYEEMMRQLRPERVILYGNVSDELEGNVLRVKPFYEQIKRKKDV